MDESIGKVSSLILSDESNRVYRVIQPENNSTKTSDLKENELAAIIADALLGEPYAVQLVARFDDNVLEMEKDWEPYHLSEG